MMDNIKEVDKIKVLIVDDSALVRKILSAELAKDPEIEVVGTAPDAYIARDKIVKLSPHVILLDIEMPRMDGLTFLEKLMTHHPMPVIIVSALVKNSANLALKALELGAAEVIAKPGSSYSVGDMGEQLREKIKAVYYSKKPIRLEKPVSVDIKINKGALANKIIAIGASTGGTEALQSILMSFPPDMPPILVVQHMPQHFTKTMAEHLDKVCNMNVKEAEDGDIAKFGTVLVAPGNKHMVLKKRNDSYYVEIKDGELVHHQRPSIEVLFRSVAKYAGENAIGVILTGMGKDGARGLLEMRNMGGFTIGQDEESSVVYGMPKEAFDIGALSRVASIELIPNIIMESLVD
jgi:two-component system chemotaxis response regulator CheB